MQQIDFLTLKNVIKNISPITESEWQLFENDIYEKLPYEALNRHFCQTAVSGCPFSVRAFSQPPLHQFL